MDCYVVEESSEKKEITDFVSFYTLTSSILNHEKHKEMKSAYLYYYATTKTPLPQLLKAALAVAKQSDHDVFKCLDMMDNRKFFEELRFEPASGNLLFYLYNYAVPTVKAEELGVVMV